MAHRLYYSAEVVTGYFSRQSIRPADYLYLADNSDFKKDNPVFKQSLFQGRYQD